MAEQSEYILAPLREAADFTFYRGTERGSQMPILAVAAAGEQPSPQNLRRLEHEYSLATKLDAAWAAQPFRLTRHQGRTLLILKDPGGEPLDRLIEQHQGQLIDITRFLLIAVGQTLDFVRSHPEAWMTAVHPEDRETAAKAFWEGVHSGQGFAFETRSLRARDRTYRWHLQQAVVLRDPEGKVLKFAGTTTDIDDQKRTEEALRQAQGDLERINRVTTMGELAASLAHEISQPLSGVITNTNVCLRKLKHDKPDLDEVRSVVAKIGKDAQRATKILDRIRSQFQKDAQDREVLDVNEINRETVALLRDEAVRYNISVRTELAADLPKIIGDRVQLQQVVMNLIVNSIEAMKNVDGIREMVIQSQRTENQQILVSITDTGVGIPPQLAEQIFDPFFTTKPQGTGMGLRISRSIIESHGGRLWAASSHGSGATFYLNLPTVISGQRPGQDSAMKPDS